MDVIYKIYIYINMLSPPRKRALYVTYSLVLKSETSLTGF